MSTSKIPYEKYVCLIKEAPLTTFSSDSEPCGLCNGVMRAEFIGGIRPSREAYSALDLLNSITKILHCDTCGPRIVKVSGKEQYDMFTNIKRIFNIEFKFDTTSFDKLNEICDGCSGCDSDPCPLDVERCPANQP